MIQTAYLRMDLELRAPVMATVAGGDANSVRSALALPGSMLRGAVAAELMRFGDATSAVDSAFRRLILSGEVRWLPAYPVSGGVPDGPRALPMPLSLHTRVDGPPPAGATTTSLFDLACDAPDAPLARADGFLAPGSPAAIVSVEASSRIHNQRDRERGRPWTERAAGGDVAHGAVYSYESIDAGQRFAALVQLRGDVVELEALVRDHLPGTLFLGRSRRATYGGSATVHLAATPQQREHEGPWRLAAADLLPGQAARLLLTSPAIVRDALSGQADPGVLAQVVATALGVEATLTTYGDRVVVSGYNRHWRSPLAQEPAAAAGTVLVVEPSERVPVERWLALEQAGLGERRVDGYGRAVWLVAAAAEVTATRTAAGVPASAAPAELSSLARRIDARIIDARRGRSLDAAIGRIEVKSPPRASLAARLRAPLRDGTTGLTTLRAWLGDGDERLRTHARDQADRCQLVLDQTRTLPLSDVLRALLDEAPRSAVVHPARKWLLEHADVPAALGGAAAAATTVDDDVIVAVLDKILARVRREAVREGDVSRSRG